MGSSNECVQLSDPIQFYAHTRIQKDTHTCARAHSYINTASFLWKMFVFKCSFFHRTVIKWLLWSTKSPKLYKLKNSFRKSVIDGDQLWESPIFMQTLSFWRITAISHVFTSLIIINYKWQESSSVLCRLFLSIFLIKYNIIHRSYRPYFAESNQILLEFSLGCCQQAPIHNIIYSLCIRNHVFIGRIVFPIFILKMVPLLRFDNCLLNKPGSIGQKTYLL